jgi:hypothetical protein
MAKHQVIIVSDDLDNGAEIAEGDARTFRFTFEGAEYTLDTSADNYEAAKDRSLRELMEIAISVGGRSRRPGSSPARNKAGKNDTAQIRAWARENGYAVSEKGRVPETIVADYRKIHG